MILEEARVDVCGANRPVEDDAGTGWTCRQVSLRRQLPPEEIGTNHDHHTRRHDPAAASQEYGTAHGF